jgi:hypothetical protein
MSLPSRLYCCAMSWQCCVARWAVHDCGQPIGRSLPVVTLDSGFEVAASVYWCPGSDLIQMPVEDGHGHGHGRAP